MTQKKARRTPIHPPFVPYGFMNDEWRWDIATRRVPVGLHLAGRPATAGEWASWLAEMARELASALWPCYEPQSNEWVGDAVDTMLDLTNADLKLMSVLRTRLQQPLTLSDKPLDLTHLKAFELEDEPRPTDPRYASLDAYVPKLAPDVLETLKGAIKQHLYDLGPAPLRLKELLQRPRAYQVALMLGVTDFRYQHARSAVSPAMVSGHAMQGLMGRCAGYLKVRRDLERVPGAPEALEQYAVDIGDRRVYAGVHYPSDNLASWIVSLRLAGPMFVNAGGEAHAFMVRAIRRSPVLAAMREYPAPDKGKPSPYAAGLALLDKAIGSPPDPVLP